MREAPGARIAFALLAACALLLLSGAGSARAGEWAQASCVNPNGSAAPSQGWTGSSVGTGDGAAATTACAPGSPMSADLSAAAPEPVYSHVDLTYAPPAGSTIIGGELSIYAVGTGSGQSATGDAEVYEPAEAYPTDVRYSCAQYFGPCSSSGATFTGTVTLPADLGGDVIVSAQCGGAAGGTCDAGATDGAWARVDVDSTDFVLQNDAVPTAADIIGTALARRVRGTGHVILQAADSGGPGVYEVTATIDGHVVAQETPSNNGGACVAQGTYPGTSALIFDSQQPCPQDVPAELSIPTVGLSDGSHELEVSVTDAAGNSAPVLDRTITTYNPQPTPAPRSGVKTRFSVSWSWAGTSTRLRSITVAKLSRQARVRVYDTGPHRPRLRDRVESARHIRSLLRHLGGLRFHAGDRLYLIVSQPHRRTERIRLTIRAGRVPVARLLRR